MPEQEESKNPYSGISKRIGDVDCSEKLIDIEELRELISERKILWREHALQRMRERNISKMDVKNAIHHGEIIEDYPDDYPAPSCLLLGCSVRGRYIHVVCGILDDTAVIITAYAPSLNLWESDLRTRRL